MTRRFAQVDVFGDGDAFGNPVAVVAGADDLPADEMQRLTNWTNLSETTFLLAPTQAGADYRVRIFTRSEELPFAGHPTLGSAHAWRALNDLDDPARPIVQECGVGLVELRERDGRLALAAPPLIRSGPLDDRTLADVAATLGVDPGEIVDHAFTDNGPGWATVRLASAAAVLALSPRPGPALHVGVVGLHPDGTPELRAIVDHGTAEDPVTGSLNAGVAMWLLGDGTLTAPYVARQGTAIGRRGRIHVERDERGTIWVGGQTRTIVAGTIDA